jgi:chromosome segregation protein
VVKNELDENLKKWYAFTMNRFSDQKKAILKDLEGRDEILKKAQGELELLIQKMEEIKNSSGNLDNRQKDLRNDLEGIQVKIDGCIKNLAIYETKLKIEQERKDRPSVEAVAISFEYIKEKIADIYDAINDILDLVKKSKDDRPIVENDITNIEAKTKELLNEITSGKVPIDKKIIEAERAEKDKIISELADEVARIKEIYNALNAEKEKIRQNIENEVSGDKERRSEFFALQGEINRAETVVYKLRNEKQLIVIEETKINTRVEDLISEIKSEMGQDFLVEIEKTVPGEINEYEIKEKIEKLKREYIQIGGIDPMVINECKETDERYNFLSKELGDLELAIVDLRKVIAQLDEKIDEQFTTIFKKINFEFNKYFRLIFGGGGASLELFEITPKTSEENAEAAAISEEEEEKSKKREKGINVKVSIPGRKVKDLETLSGGERSLTSSAILFAIIASNPPPFVVLDEIDAALDETNSQKIAVILGELGNTSQFIVITHNRAMMRQAKTIYGVSMTDESISKIISVKIDEMK